MEKSLYFSYQFILVKLDKKGGLYLPKEIRNKFNVDEFYISVVPEGILLVPRVKDPIKVLEEEGKKLPQNLSIEKLKKKALEEAEKEIGLPLIPISIIKNEDWLKRKASLILQEYKNDISTSIATFIEILLISKKFSLDPIKVTTSIMEIIGERILRAAS